MNLKPSGGRILTSPPGNSDACLTEPSSILQMGIEHPEKGNNLPKCKEQLRGRARRGRCAHRAVPLSQHSEQIPQRPSVSLLEERKSTEKDPNRLLSSVGTGVRQGRWGGRLQRDGVPLILEHWPGSRELALQIQASGEHRPRGSCHRSVKSQRRDQFGCSSTITPPLYSQARPGPMTNVDYLLG